MLEEETRRGMSASDWIAVARIGQMIEDALLELRLVVDPEGPTQLLGAAFESAHGEHRDTMIEV